MATQQDVLKNFVASLDKTNLSGTAAVDEAVKACSSFTSYSDLMNHFLADRNNSASGEDFLKRYCGINLDNDDTGAITGSDAGGSFVKTAESVVPEVIGNVSIYPPSNSFSYKGLTVNVPAASSLTENQKNIVAGLYTWWLKAGLDLVEETYGFSFEDSDATFKTINLDFNENHWTHSFSVSRGKQVTSFTLHINSDIFNNITRSDKNGINSSSNEIEYLDRVIAFSFARAIMMAKVNYETNLPDMISKGIATQVDGYDDRRKTEILELVNNTENIAKYVASSTPSSSYYNIPMGFVLLRYLAKQAADVETNIPSDVFEYNGHSYYLYSGVAQTWEEAQAYCQARGGHLAVINDANENTALFNYMKSSGYSNAYFGLSDDVIEGIWHWIDGSPLSYANWASGEPNGRQSENYGMFYYKFDDGKWNDGDGKIDSYSSLICEWDGVSEADAVKIDEATALEVINLFHGMDTASKKTALEENLKTLESLKSLVEGDKKIEIVDEETGRTYYTDSKNLIECLKAFYDDDAPEWLTDYTKYVHDFKGHIVYKFHYQTDSSGQRIRVFDLDAGGNRIPVEHNKQLREAAGNTLGITVDICSAAESIDKIRSGELNGVETAAEISNLSGNIVNITGAIRQLGGFDKAGTIAPIASAFLGSIGSIISLFDGVEPEEVVDVVKDTLESVTILSEYALKPEFATTKIGTMLGGNSFVTTKLKPIAETLNANALKVNLGVSVALGLVMGGVQYFKSAEQYQIDGLKDSLAAKDKWTDAFTTGIKTFLPEDWTTWHLGFYLQELPTRFMVLNGSGLK